MEEKDKNISTTEEVVEEEIERTDVLPEEGEEPAVQAIEEWEGHNKEPKKKRKLSKGKLALICVGGFFLLLAIGVGLFFLIGYLMKTDHNTYSRKLSASAPQYETTIEKENYDQIEEALTLAQKTDLTETDKDKIKAQIAYLYNLANANKIDKSKTGQSITFLQGEGGATLMGATGTMAVRGMKIQSGDVYYYQKGAMIIDCNVKPLQATLEGSLNQQERAYADIAKSVYKMTGTLKGKKAKILNPDEIEFVPFIEIGNPDTVETKSKSTFMTDGYYLNDPREITNFRIKKEYIVLDESKLGEGEKFIEYKDGYYICHFSLDYLNDTCVEKAREYLRKSAMSDDLQYWKYDVTLEVWNNGYFKRMYDEEGWGGTTLGQTTTSSNTYEIATYYNFDADLKKLFSEEDQAKYEGDDWAAKIIADYAEESMKLN